MNTGCQPFTVAAEQDRLVRHSRPLTSLAALLYAFNPAAPLQHVAPACRCRRSDAGRGVMSAVTLEDGSGPKSATTVVEHAGDVKRRQQKSKEWKKITPRSLNLELYYQASGIFRDKLEQEWPSFMDALARPLPVTFRINKLYCLAGQLEIELAALFEQLKNSSMSAVMDPIEWLPGTFTMPFKHSALRKMPELEALQRWFTDNRVSGRLSRQKSMSMVPPLFLDVQPHHAVLDMCAAPGSKTFQILEMLHASKAGAQLMPEGFVLANDVNSKRLMVLMQNCKRLGSFNFGVMVHPAQRLPLLQGGNAFDRVLADVPCTCDGTLRKHQERIEKWNTLSALEMHQVQIDILRHAVRNCKVGGRVVYSTCSLNPVEDESVVAQVLREAAGSVLLRDCTAELPGLHRESGLSTWPVLSDNGRLFTEGNLPEEHKLDDCMLPRSRDSVAAAAAVGFAVFDHWEDVPENNTMLSKSMFPPSEEERRLMKLERCMRFFPHHHDAVGFFVAVLDKVDEFSPVAGYNKVAKDIHKALRWRALQYTPLSDGIYAEISQLYGLLPSFPRENLLVASDRESTVNLVPTSLRHTMLNGNATGNVLWMGIKCFYRAGGPHVPFRVAREALPILLPYLTRRVLRSSVSDFARISRGGALPAITDSGLSQSFVDAFLKFDTGCVVVLLDIEDAVAAASAAGHSSQHIPRIGDRDVLALSVHRGRGITMTVYMSMNDSLDLRASMRRLHIMPRNEDKAERAADAAGLKFLMA